MSSPTPPPHTVVVWVLAQPGDAGLDALVEEVLPVERLHELMRRSDDVLVAAPLT